MAEPLDAPRPSLTIICAWCGVVLAWAPVGVPPGAPSHGICQTCYRRVLIAISRPSEAAPRPEPA